MSLLLAFGFGNLAMLGWLAAAAAPLLIHLWSRHRFREAPWAAMQFLLAAMRKNARRMQLQQWLLLVVRTLIIALVVLAVAEPYGERLTAGGSGTPIHKVLVIDGSFSMACSDAGMTRFQQAKQIAARIVRDSRAADSFTVILMGAPPKLVLGREVIDHAKVDAEIDALKQRHTTANLPATLTLVEEALAGDTNGRRSPERQDVYFITDLQRGTWQLIGSPAEHGSENVKEQLAAISGAAAMSVIEVEQSRTANLAATSLTSPDTFATIGRDVTFHVSLHQFGQEPATDRAVELIVDDVPVAEQTVTVPAGDDAEVRFTHRFQSAGEHTVAIRAAGDPLEIDNARWLVVPVREEVRALCVAGREGAAKYVADALNPNPAGDSPIRPIVVSDAELADLEFSDFDCVFFCNVARLTRNEADRIAAYVATGGGAVFFLGDRVLPESYNALTADKRPLIPARLGEVVSRTSIGLDPLDYRHAIVAPFRGRERAGLLTTPVSRYFKLDTSQSQADVEVAVAVSGGDPFIVTSPLGFGRVALVATDGSLSSVDATTGEPWTNWPTWPSFLPVVRELLAYASGGHQNQWQRLVGRPLSNQETATIGVRSEAATGELKITRPDGRTAPVSIQLLPAGWQWSYSDTDVSGIYTLHGLPNDESQRFAVNVDAAESDLARIDKQDLPPELQVRTTPQSGNTQDATTVSRAGWNESILWSVVVLLLVESFLAWQFGRGAL